MYKRIIYGNLIYFIIYIIIFTVNHNKNRLIAQPYYTHKNTFARCSFCIHKCITLTGVRGHEDNMQIRSSPRYLT